MLGDSHIAAAASLLAEPTRAAMLLMLSDGRALPAGELAHAAHIAPSTASEHLAKLVDAGFLQVETWGRHRYFRLASPSIAEALEALALIAPPMPIRSLHDADRGATVRFARTCYRHLAGTLGVTVTQALVAQGVIDEEESGYRITSTGMAFFHDFGICERGQQKPAHFVAYHIDWSERQRHIAGPLAVAFTQRLLDLAWIVPMPSSRALRITEKGCDGLKQLLDIKPDQLQMKKQT